jgi:hypothetical protein
LRPESILEINACGCLPPFERQAIAFKPAPFKFGFINESVDLAKDGVGVRWRGGKFGEQHSAHVACTYANAMLERQSAVWRSCSCTERIGCLPIRRTFQVRVHSRPPTPKSHLVPPDLRVLLDLAHGQFKLAPRLSG